MSTIRDRNLSIAEKLLAQFDETGCPVSWMDARLPADARRITDEHPPLHKEVLGWVTDADVCIWFFPVVVRWDGHTYWAGLPGKWIDLEHKRWTLTHWRPL